jgi:hypothetical protein
MPIKESSATALVRFTGLGIICFNDARQRGEIAAIRDDKHTLTIKLQQPVFQEGSGSDIIVYEDIAAYKGLPKEDVRLEIKAAGKPAIEGYEIYRQGDFDRLDSPDANDFRWIVNVDALHAGEQLRPAQGRYPLSKIYIGNGLFYTHKLDRNLFFEKVEKDEQGRTRERQVFGNVGETIGVKIEGEEVSVTIGIGESEETHTLRRVEGLPFRIEISNMDNNPNAVYSDMADYYGYLAPSNGSRFELAPMIEEAQAAKGGAVNQVQFCHPVASDLPTIDDPNR